MKKHVLFLFSFLLLVQIVIGQALNGIYTVGSGKTYTQINDAVTALNSKGISGNVVFSIDPALYSEQITINNFSQGANDTVFFTCSNPNDSVKMSHAGNSVDYRIVYLNGCKNIVFQNFSFSQLDTSYGVSVDIAANCENIIFRNNKFYAGAVYSFHNNLSHCSASYVSAKNLVFQNNVYEGGGNGIYLYGNSIINDIEISGNSFSNTYGSDVYMYSVENLTINNNTFEVNHGLYNELAYIEKCNGVNIIRNNIFHHNTFGGKAVGINNCTPSDSSKKNIIYNNFFYLTDKGMVCLSFASTNYTDIFHNTFYQFSTDNGVLIEAVAGFDHYSIKNNLFIQRIVSDKRIFWTTTGVPNTTEIDYNAYFHDVNFGYNPMTTTNYPDLNSWKAAFNTDAHSAEYKGTYNSWLSNGYHISCSLPKEFRVGSDLGSDYKFDKDGEARTIFPCWPGANELVKKGSETVNLNGKIKSGTFFITAGTVELYADISKKTMLDKMYTTTINNDGSFSFIGIPSRDYVLHAVPDATKHSDKLPTYYGGDFHWTSFYPAAADTCSSGTDLLVEVDSLIPQIIGTGTISGYLNYDIAAGKTNDPIPGLDIVLDKIPPSVSVQKTTTDANGFYQFNHISNGSYRVKIDFPGLHNDSLFYLTIDEKNQSYETSNYCVDTGKVTYVCNSALGVTIFPQTMKRFNILPNPFQNEIIILNPKNQNINISIYDITGRVILSGNLDNSEKATLNTASVEAGIYFMQIVNQGQIENHKIIKE